tara:strand:- start:2073 stop:2261 length:189 start_codon:yes stop_codon:yes gene_type:complete
MEKWQFIFVNLAIGGFIFQMILIVGVYFISKCLLKEKTDKELLESIFKQPSLSDYYLRNLKI